MLLKGSNKYNKIVPGTGIKMSKKARAMKPDCFFLPAAKDKIIKKKKIL